MPAFKKMQIIDKFSNSPAEKYNSQTIKKAFMALLKIKDVKPEKSDVNDFFDLQKVAAVFNLEHEYFKQKNYEILPRETYEQYPNTLSEITPEKLRVTKNPWPGIKEGISELESVDRFQTTLNHPAFFI